MKDNDREIDISLYKMFYLVCQNGCFSKTAEILGVTQPSISYNMKKLEDSIGVKLFERGSNLSLTSEGETLLPYVEEAINSLKKGEYKVNELLTFKSGKISVGVPSHIGVFLLTDILKQFNSVYPNIKIKVNCKPTKELFRLLSNNELDVVIDCSPLEENIFKFDIVKIAKEKCVFACNKNNLDFQGKVVTLSDISSQQLIVPLRTSGSTKALASIFDKYNVTFDPMFEIATSDMIAEMVSKNLGIGYLFEKTLTTYPLLQKIDIDVLLPVFDVFLIYKKSLLSIATEKFINYILTNIKKTV